MHEIMNNPIVGVGSRGRVSLDSLAGHKDIRDSLAGAGGGVHPLGGLILLSSPFSRNFMFERVGG